MNFIFACDNISVKPYLSGICKRLENRILFDRISTVFRLVAAFITVAVILAKKSKK